jgi:hypothetical protein
MYIPSLESLLRFTEGGRMLNTGQIEWGGLIITKVEIKITHDD